MENRNLETLAQELGLKKQQVETVLELTTEGNTIPFIARYRKEKTGNLDETQIKAIIDMDKSLTALQDRKETVLAKIEAQGKLTDQLKAAIEAAEKLADVEELYLPYKEKRRTKATVAREAGLFPLARLILQNSPNLKAEAEKLKKNTENSVPATKLVPATKKENTTETSEGAGWVVPTVTEEVEEKKVEKTAEGVVLKEDPKYLAGAIQLNADGKVEFVLDTKASGKSADEIYNIVFQYMSKLIKNEQNINSRIALVNRNNKNEQIIACIMDEWFVFNQSFISLDNHLRLSMTRIVFNYEEGRSTGFKEPAEKVITDKYALTKKKNDLAKIYGKFRRGTIDRKNQIFNDLTKLVRK